MYISYVLALIAYPHLKEMHGGIWALEPRTQRAAYRVQKMKRKCRKSGPQKGKSPPPPIKIKIRVLLVSYCWLSSNKC